MEPDLSFFQHFFTETLFLVPEQQTTTASLPPLEAVPKPTPLTEVITGDTPKPRQYQVVGENKKGLIIVVSLSEQDFRSLPNNVFLSKVLGAIQHGPGDVGFVNISRGQRLSIYDLSKENNVKHLIAFGPGLLDLSADSKVNLYKPAAIGQYPLLVAEPLENIENDITKKKLLWNGLQTIFLK
ncbi:hypothetical protein [Adhaeribacter aquaticus]|uniref:hypothetical protein n=1 Tax=Adhaeribacter aquaticus TaxID=299567 RepID=UPI00040CDF04|nr:hypothetical protein [Adhaeribacter aquaticus]